MLDWMWWKGKSPYTAAEIVQTGEVLRSQRTVISFPDGG